MRIIPIDNYKMFVDHLSTLNYPCVFDMEDLVNFLIIPSMDNYTWHYSCDYEDVAKQVKYQNRNINTTFSSINAIYKYYSPESHNIIKEKVEIFKEYILPFNCESYINIGNERANMYKMITDFYFLGDLICDYYFLYECVNKITFEDIFVFDPLNGHRREIYDREHDPKVLKFFKIINKN